MQMLLSGHRHVLANDAPQTAKRRRVACCAAKEVSIKVLDRFWQVGQLSCTFTSMGAKQTRLWGRQARLSS